MHSILRFFALLLRAARLSAPALTATYRIKVNRNWLVKKRKNSEQKIDSLPFMRRECVTSASGAPLLADIQQKSDYFEFMQSNGELGEQMKSRRSGPLLAL